MAAGWPNDFSFVMPTRNRPHFVARALGFLDRQSYGGGLVLVDASDDDDHEATKDVVGEFPNLNISHTRPARTGNAWAEIAAALEVCEARYVQLHHDDDFCFIGESARAAEILDNDAAVASAQGRFIWLEHNSASGEFEISAHDRFAYDADDCLDRIRACLARFGHQAFAVTRRQVFIDALAGTAKYLGQGWFDQYALSLLMVAAGKTAVFDGLFSVRQRHPGQHHLGFTGARAYEHWPLIIAAPNFSKLFVDFKSCVGAGIAAHRGGGGGDLDAILDEGLVSLVIRASGVLPEREAGDEKIFAACNRAGTAENERVKQAVAAVRAHPLTQGA